MFLKILKSFSHAQLIYSKWGVIKYGGEKYKTQGINWLDSKCNVSKRELPIWSTSTTPYGEYYSLYGVVKNLQIHSCGKIFEFNG